MNVLVWNLKYKSRAKRLFETYDILGLMELYNEIDDINFLQDMCYDYVEMDIERLLECFDEKGHYIDNRYPVENYVASIFNFIVSADPSVKSKLDENHLSIYRFIHPLMQTLGEDRTFAEKTYLALSHAKYYKEDMRKFLVDNKLTPAFFDYYFKKYVVNEYYGNTGEKIPRLLREHLSKEELNIIHCIINADWETDEREVLADVFENVDRKLIPEIISFKKKKNKYTAVLNLSPKTLPTILYSSMLRTKITEQYGENLESYLKQFLTPLEIAYFKKNDTNLDKLFENQFEHNISNLAYLKGEQIVVKPEVIEHLIEVQEHYSLLYILSYYFNEADYNKIDYEALGIKKESLIYIADIFKNLDALKKSDASVRFLLNSLYENPGLLSVDPANLANLKDIIIEISNRIDKSNSQELKAFGTDILTEMLNNGPDFDYVDALNKIEDVFTRNNLPLVGKKYLIYYILNKSLAEEDLDDNLIVSPTLKETKGKDRFKIIFSDLIRCTMGSNNLSMRHYLIGLKQGNDLYNSIINGRNINELDEKEQEILKEFLNHLSALYNHTQAGIKEPYNLTGDLMEDISNLIPKYKANQRYSLLDRIVRMYGFYAGFTSYDQAMTYMDRIVREANERGKRMAYSNARLNKGDMVKGVRAEYLYQILQNGSLCKEFLGASMSSDSTPLDTDLSYVLKSGRSIEDTIENSKSSGFGAVFFVIKNGKYSLSRNERHGETLFTTEGPECFVTLENDHVGIRTGFPTTDIDYIILNTEDYPELINQVKFAIALNGIYLPVFDYHSEKLIFPPEEFDLIRSKMQGLTYYGSEEFKVSENLRVPVDYDNEAIIKDSKFKRSVINQKIRYLLASKFNLKMSTSLTSDLTLGGVDFVDTGSTGRGTNVDMASDFDFIMRIDECLDSKDIAYAILEELGISIEEARDKEMLLGNGNLRIKGVYITGIDVPIDIDISFVSKASTVSYTTDMAINDRLEFIKKNHPDKYEDVLDNIMYAKKWLKDAEAYKPNHARENSQGGLGGVGVENWILQNGGSFYDACQSFYKAATGKDGRIIPFEEFKERYKVYDFGENYFGNKRQSNYDEFVENNMTEAGYKKMYDAVIKYIKKFESDYHYDGKQHQLAEELTKENKKTI